MSPGQTRVGRSCAVGDWIRCTRAAISGTDGARFPFYSPDGRSIGFFIEGDLLTVPASGGPAKVVSRGTMAYGGSWGADGRIVFSPGPYSGLRVVPASGGNSQALSEVAPDESGHGSPQILPSGEAVLFIAGTSSGGDVVVLSLVTGERRIVARGASYARYVPTGHVLFSREGALFAVGFDEARLEAEGAPVALLDGLSPTARSFAVSTFGALLYFAGDIDTGGANLVWVDRSGAVDPLTLSPRRNCVNPRLSPDGRSVVFHGSSVSGGNIIDLWLYDVARDVFRRLTFNASMEASPIWTPDGERIIFTVAQPNLNSLSLHWMPIDGSAPMERLTSTDDVHIPSDVSPDGSLLVFTERNPDTGMDIWLLPLHGDGEPRPFLRTSYNEAGGSVSPNGHFLAYVSDETGKQEIYVERFPEGGAKMLISTGGARDPFWAADGRELFYQWNNTMYSAEIVSFEPFTVGAVQRLFEIALPSLPYGRAGYHVARDGRFLIVERNVADSAVRELRVVTDLFQILEDKIRGAQD